MAQGETGLLVQRLPVLALMARVLTGEALVVAPAGPHALRLLPAVLWSEALRLPADVPLDAPAADRVRMLRGLLLLQLALRTGAAGRDDAARRAALRDASPLVRRLACALEEVRAGALVLRAWPGARRDLELLWSRPVAARPLVARVDQVRGVVLGDSVDLPGNATGRLLAAFGEGARRGELGWADSLATAQRLAGALPRFGAVRWRAPPEPAQAEPAGATAGGARQPMTLTGTAQPGAGQAGAMTGAGLAHGAARPGPAAPGGPPGDEPAEPAAAGVQAYFYDEWDAAASALRPRWCRVLQRQAPHGPAQALRDALHAVQREIAGQAHALARPSGHLQEDGPELDLDAVVTEWSDRAAGGGGATRFYRQPQRRLEDTAVAVVVDTSASTDHAMPARHEPEPAEAPAQDEAFWFWPAQRTPAPRPVRRVIDVAREAAAAVLALAATGGAAAGAFAFSGKGRHRVDIAVAQPLGEAFGKAGLQRLAGLAPGGATRTGAALRHAAAVLRARPESRKLLVLITDGYPQDDDYGPGNDVAYAVEDTRRAWQDLRMQGIAALCVPIDPAGYGFHRGFCAPAEAWAYTGTPALLQEVARRFAAPYR